MIKDIYLILLFFLFSTSVYAKTIKIVSDTLEVIRTDNISIFSGNVYALDENLKIWSEKLVIATSEDEEAIKEINALDNVKIIREGLTVNGNKAKYDPVNDKLFVFGEVRVTQNNNVILCDEIIVDLKNSSSIMKSESTKRVEALIFSEDED